MLQRHRILVTRAMADGAVWHIDCIVYLNVSNWDLNYGEEEFLTSTSRGHGESGLRSSETKMMTMIMMMPRGHTVVTGTVAKCLLEREVVSAAGPCLTTRYVSDFIGKIDKTGSVDIASSSNRLHCVLMQENIRVVEELVCSQVGQIGTSFYRQTFNQTFVFCC